MICVSMCLNVNLISLKKIKMADKFVRLKISKVQRLKISRVQMLYVDNVKYKHLNTPLPPLPLLFHPSPIVGQT